MVEAYEVLFSKMLLLHFGVKCQKVINSLFLQFSGTNNTRSTQHINSNTLNLMITYCHLKKIAELY